MTEDEAKTKWCPMARVPGSLQHMTTGEVEKTGAQNRGYSQGGPLHNCMCIASACMWWRWEFKKHHHASGDFSHETQTERGHCGLAGKP